MYMIIDIEKCVGCFNCMIACKDEHVGNSWLPYTDEQQKHDQKWIVHEKHERGVAPFTDMCFVARMCMHCKDAPCEKAKPDAVKRRFDGVVLLDADKAKGNRALVDACPFGNISWNEELGVAQKCTLCAHLLDDGWKEPRCVQACPLRALCVVHCSDAEMQGIIKSQQLEPLAGCGSSPRVMYRNLYRRNTCFISGGLAYRDGGIEKTAAGAVVKLLKDGELIAEVESDFFGEFKFDRIQKNSGAYEITCSLESFTSLSSEVSVGESSVCLDVMMFL